MPPEDVQRIVAHAQDREACTDCGAGRGQPCDRPGPGRSVHKSRFIAAAIVVRRQGKAAQRTAEQTAILARLPRVTETDIDAARTPRGGWTRETLAV